jgi:potassium-transporting ATPase KdpC subunit
MRHIMNLIPMVRPALVLVLLFTALTGVAFPLAFVGLGQALFPGQANGDLIRVGGRVVGSALIGQNFTAARYFHPRPSATTEPDPANPDRAVAVPYAADNSGASNLGPTSRALIDRVRAAIRRYGPGPVPADAVTTSASGLDPDISPENASHQVVRVAAARHLPIETVRALLAHHTRHRLFGFIGEPRVNVLELNLALDRLAPRATAAHAASP